MNNPNGFMGKLYQGVEFLYHLLFLNVLWLAFTLLGGIVLGFGPSTVALYAVTRKWIQKEIGTDKDIFLTYWTTFKKEFIAGNMIGWSTLIVFYMLLVNYRFTNLRPGSVFAFINAGTIVMAGVLCVLLAYLIPLYVHYRLKWSDYLTKALVLSFIQPLPTILIIVWLALVAFLTWRLFPFSLLVSMSGLAYGLMGICYSSFMRNEFLLEDKEKQKSTHYYSDYKGEKK